MSRRKPVIPQIYETRVDALVELLTSASFPLQLFFLKDGVGLGMTVRPHDVTQFDPSAPGVRPDSVINADYPAGLVCIQAALKAMTKKTHPKGQIRDAIREAWRRKFNALQIEAAAERGVNPPNLGGNEDDA